MLSRMVYKKHAFMFTIRRGDDDVDLFRCVEIISCLHRIDFPQTNLYQGASMR